MKDQQRQIGGTIKRLREAAGMSVRQLADKTGISVELLDQIEAGKVSLNEAQLEKLRQHPIFRNLLTDGEEKTGTGNNGTRRGNGMMS